MLSISQSGAGGLESPCRSVFVRSAFTVLHQRTIQFRYKFIQEIELVKFLTTRFSNDNDVSSTLVIAGLLSDEPDGKRFVRLTVQQDTNASCNSAVSTTISGNYRDRCLEFHNRFSLRRSSAKQANKSILRPAPYRCKRNVI